MRKILVMSSMVFVIAGVFGLSIGALVGKEFGGSNRLYVGATLNSGGLVAVGLDAYYSVTSFETVGEELQNIQILELDPMLLLNFDLEGASIYAGAGPIIMFDVDNFQFELFSMYIVKAKVGASISLGAVSLFVEGSTLGSYNPIMTTGIYSLQLGVALGL